MTFLNVQRFLLKPAAIMLKIARTNLTNRINNKSNRPRDQVLSLNILKNDMSWHLNKIGSYQKHRLGNTMIQCWFTMSLWSGLLRSVQIHTARIFSYWITILMAWKSCPVWNQMSQCWSSSNICYFTRVYEFAFTSKIKLRKNALNTNEVVFSLLDYSNKPF